MNHNKNIVIVLLSLSIIDNGMGAIIPMPYGSYGPAAGRRWESYDMCTVAQF